MAENAQLRLDQRSLDDAIQEGHDLLERATAKYRPEATYLLLSGGNDSMVLLDSMIEHADAIVHMNTGIGIPDANEHARIVAAGYDRPLIELHPPIPYEELVLTHKLFKGMPGPGLHRIVYQRLKERCLRQIPGYYKSKPGGLIALVSGVRKAESRRRMGLASPINREKRDGKERGAVWVNPLFFVENHEMREYREREELPQSEVAANLHMSGECLCGAMADQRDEGRSERAAIEFFYPEFHRGLCDLEEECRSRGLPYTEWGVKRPNADPDEEVGPLCQSCAGRQERLFESAVVIG